MGIINPVYPFKFGNEITRKNGVKINCADKVNLFEKQVEEEPEIVFNIMQFPP
jgi:hypothetical protein